MKKLGTTSAPVQSGAVGSSSSRGSPSAGCSGPSIFATTALIECCCGPSSFLADEARKSGLEALRLTQDSFAIGTSSGDKAAHAEITRLAKADHKIHLWASLPCRPWSTWTELNLKKLGRKFRAKIAQAREQSLVLINSFVALAKHIDKVGGLGLSSGLVTARAGLSLSWGFFFK